MIKPDIAASIAAQYVRHADHLFAYDGKALEFVRFSQQAGLFGGASMDTLADQCFYAALALEPVPDMVHTVSEPDAWSLERKMRVAFALGCQQDSLGHLPVAPFARKLAEDCLHRLRDRKSPVTAEDSYIAAASWLWNCDGNELLWRRFQREDFFNWSLPYLVMLQQSGLDSPDLRHVLHDRLSIAYSKDAAVTSRELLDSIRILVAMRHSGNVDPYFRILANSTDGLKKCERSAAAWLLEKVQGTALDSELLEYLRREDWLNRPHRSNISWMRNRKFVNMSALNQI